MEDSRIIATMEALRIDQLAAEVLRALASHGCRAILIKGPTTALWLYDDGYARGYGDVDVLVAPTSIAYAESVLAALGFESLATREHLPEIDHSHSWVREANEFVDLHFSVPGADSSSPSTVWAALEPHTETWVVGGHEALALDPVARALVVVLHAIHNGPGGASSMDDLRRVLPALSGPEWRATAELAGSADVDGAFSAGLRLVPDGAALADELLLTTSASTRVLLRAHGASSAALSVERLARSRGVREFVAGCLRELFPTPQGLRLVSPVANKGRAGLALAYATRPLGVVRRLPRALAEWQTARSRARDSRSVS